MAAPLPRQRLGHGTRVIRRSGPHGLVAVVRLRWDNVCIMKQNTVWIVVVMVGLVSVPLSSGQEIPPKGKVLSWAETVDAVKRDPALADAVRTLTAEARAEVKRGLVRRVYRYEDVGKHRTSLDGRAKVLEDEIRTTFALAMSDFSSCNRLATALPAAAAVVKITDDAAIREHVLAQLREMTTWSPLQRPGWTLFRPGARFPKDNTDGNWLATGCGVRAIVTTLEILGDDVDAELVGAFKTLLSKEIPGVVDDWKTKRPWFVRTDNAITNQWVLPTEGLVRACLYLGRETHRDAYELGVKNLLQALSSHGKEGEFEEGIGYSLFTVTSLLHTARAMAVVAAQGCDGDDMAVVGDRRAIDHPFLVRYPTWAAHHIQPGRMTVNCFDAGRAANPRNHASWRSSLSLLVFAGESEVANWALAEQFDGPTDDLPGLMARVTGKRLGRTPPTLFKAYERAPMVVWRDSWADDANGVWVRGGHPRDGHDHQDRGHVNFIARGKPLLIEAGTPSYSDPDMPVHYSSGAGHNILQVGTFFPERPYPVQQAVKYAGWQQRHGVAPITVRKLGATGGWVSIDASRCYAEVAQWVREVEWTAAKLSVRDAVTLEDGKKDVVLFRWHLGTGEEVAVAGSHDGRYVTVRWADAHMKLEANEPLTVETYKAPDATVSRKTDQQHVCVQVASRAPVESLRLATTVRPIVPAQPNDRER